MRARGGASLPGGAPPLISSQRGGLRDRKPPQRGRALALPARRRGPRAPPRCAGRLAAGTCRRRRSPSPWTRTRSCPSPTGCRSRCAARTGASAPAASGRTSTCCGEPRWRRCSVPRVQSESARWSRAGSRYARSRPRGRPIKFDPPVVSRVYGRAVARFALLTAVALLALGGVARGEALVPVQGSSLSAPMYVTSPPDDARLFVVERAGTIRIVKDGMVLPTPFLTVPHVAQLAERGLSSMAFAPDYATSGLFYVFTTLDDPGRPDNGQIQVVEYQRSSNPDLADPAKRRLVLARDHPDANHYGGQLAFGPDRYLYITMGDNDGNTGAANGQDTKTTLGKVLRIEPPGGTPSGT